MPRVWKSSHQVGGTQEGIELREAGAGRPGRCLLREDPTTRQIPVLIVSGRDLDLKSVPGAPWLRKPVPPEDLMTHIRRAAAGRV